MRLIDADELKECIKDRFKIETEENLLQYKSLQEILEFMLRKFEDKVIHRIDLQPTVDAVHVVRCKDCKHRVEPTKMCMHPKAIGWDAIEPEDDDFCSYGEKKEVEE